MGSLKRKLRRQSSKRRNKMSVILPLVKVVKSVKLTNVQVINHNTGIPTGERESRIEEVIMRNDAETFLTILTQVDFNKSERKKQRKAGTKLMDALQEWSFQNEVNESCDTTITITDSEIDVLYDVCIKDVPDDVKLSGIRLLRTIHAFEDWHDERERKKKEADSTKEAPLPEAAT